MGSIVVFEILRLVNYFCGLFTKVAFTSVGPALRLFLSFPASRVVVPKWGPPHRLACGLLLPVFVIL